MSMRKEEGRKSLRGALEIRRRAGVPRDAPLCVYDVAEKLGVEVKFVALSSFGGMYVKTSKTILVPSLRPAGRRMYTCGHELGHWFFNHGTRIEELDQIDSEKWEDPDERLAHVFAGFLLAPPWTVEDAFKRRGCDPCNCSPFQFYAIAGQLGMGYQSFLNHLQMSLRTMELADVNRLSVMTPKKIRAEILNEDHSGHLVIADEHWWGVPVDLEVGDVAILPQNSTLEGNCVAPLRIDKKWGLIIEARQPGIARAESSCDGWAAYVRVCRKEFQGRSIYRHMEDPDVNTTS